MFMVYWTELEGEKNIPHAKLFSTTDMSAAMHYLEQLRIRQRGGESISFITMCSENPHSVGPAGVADPAPDYNWKKRRR
jgi:hypothetical protein